MLTSEVLSKNIGELKIIYDPTMPEFLFGVIIEGFLIVGKWDREEKCMGLTL